MQRTRDCGVPNLYTYRQHGCLKKTGIMASVMWQNMQGKSPMVPPCGEEGGREISSRVKRPTPTLTVQPKGVSGDACAYKRAGWTQKAM